METIIAYSVALPIFGIIIAESFKILEKILHTILKV